MATRRKYKVRGFRDGGRVLADGGTAVEPEPAAADVPAPASPDDALRRAVEAQARAEQLQRPPPQLTPEQYIDQLAISDVKKKFLRAHPETLTDPTHNRAMATAYQQGLARGFADDSPELTAFMTGHMAFQLEQQREALAAMALPPSAPDTSADIEAQKLDNEVESHRAADRAVTPAVPQMPQATSAPRSSRMPITAPVTREVPTSGGQRASSMGQVTLTPAEREIARNSFSGMSNAEKERLYAMNKAKLARKRAEGSYPQSGQG